MSCYQLFSGYIGSKAPDVSTISAFFDKGCNEYIEPFVGGGSIFFSMSNSRYEKEYINDYNSAIAFIYKALNEEKYRESTMNAILKVEKNDDENIAKQTYKIALEKVRKIPCSYDKKLSEYAENYVSDMAAAIYIIYSQSVNCSGSAYSKRKSSFKYKMETQMRLKNSVERLSKKNLIVGNCDAFDIIKANKLNPKIQFYIDWPYIGLYRNCKNLYKTEMSGLYRHIEFAEELKNAKSAVVFSDYRCRQVGVPTIYDAILGDEWHCYKIDERYNNAAHVKKGQKRQKVSEFIWTNRVPDRAGLYCLLEEYKEKLVFEEYWERIRSAGFEGKLQSKDMKEYNETYLKLNDSTKELFSKEEIKRIKTMEKECEMHEIRG